MDQINEHSDSDSYCTYLPVSTKWWLFQRCDSEGVAAPTTQQETCRQPHCTSYARVRYVMGYMVDRGGGVSSSTLSGGEYLFFPVEGNSIKNDGLNRLISVVAALTYQYQQNRRCFTGAIPSVTRLPVPGVSWGWRSRSRYRQRDPTATHNSGPCQVCGGWGGGGISASTISK